MTIPEYNIQQEAEWLGRPQTSARGDNLGAHPPINPLFLRFREPGVPNGIAVSRQEQRFESRSRSIYSYFLSF